MLDWPTTRLGDLISIKSGFSYKGEFIGRGTSLLLGMGCVSFNETFLLSGARRYSGDVADSYLAKPGDIVLATRQQSDNLPILGAPAIIPNKLKGERIIVGTNLYKVESKSKVNNQFLFWLLRSSDYRNHIDSCSTGSTVKMITKDAVEDFDFPCPPAETRDRIADILWTLDDKIDLLHRQNKTLESLAQTLFRQWFIEEADDSWEPGTLSDVSNNIRKSVSVAGISDEVKYVALEHIEKRHIALYSCGEGKTVASNKSEFKRNDILFGKLRPYFHKVCFAPFSGICSTDILVIRPKEEIFFPYCLFAYFQDEVVDYSDLASEGTRMPRTNWEILGNYPIAIPDHETLTRFNRLALPNIQKIESNVAQIATLTVLRDALLPKLMTGEVLTGSRD